MFSREELAYAAGVLDSDGCITLTTGRPIPRIVVANTKEVLPNWFYGQLGGHIRKQDARNLRWKTTWYWILQGDPAVEFLMQVRQWLILKREQANVVIQYWAETRKLREHVGRGHPRSPELRTIDTELSARIHSLNRRGAAMKEG